MFIIDNKIASEYNEIFELYNLPHKPVRVFTYLIGKGKSKESEMKAIACNNKGKTNNYLYHRKCNFIFKINIISIILQTLPKLFVSIVLYLKC